MFFRKTKTSGVTAEIRVRRCYGCGAILQDQDKNEAGYIPSEKFNDDKEVLCERCYKLRYYSKYKPAGDFSIDYVTILNRAKEEKALVCYVLNAFSLYGSMLKEIGNYLPENVLVIINKRDILPKNFSDDYLKEKALKLLREENIKPADIIISSSGIKNQNIDLLLTDINSLRNGKSVYFIGSSQVGKSSLINCLLMNYSNSTENMITTSPYPGTTLDVISIPLDENSFLYDTPGINNSSSIISYLEPEVVKYILPRSEVRSESYPSKEGQSFLFSNFARFDFVSGEKTTFTFYKSNDLTLQRTKLNKADFLFDSICSNINYEVRSSKIKSLTEMKKITFKCAENTIYKITIKGLGFIEFKGSDQLMNLYVPSQVDALMEKIG